MNQQLIHEIAGKKYVLVDVPFLAGDYDKSEAFVKKHGLLYQGISEVSRGGLFTKTVIIQSYFCPEENFIAFSKDDLKL